MSFLNARPITYGLEGGRRERGSTFRSSCRPGAPSCSSAGDVDLGLIPVASFATIQASCASSPGSRWRPRPMRTVLLVSEQPWEALTDVALDGASRSSAMLLQLLCKREGIRPPVPRPCRHDQVLGAGAGTRARW